MASIWLQRNPGDQVEGPYSEDQIRSLGAGGQLMSHALVSIDGQPWAPASQIGGVVLNDAVAGGFSPPVRLDYAGGFGTLIGEPGKPRDLRWYLVCACIALAIGGPIQVLQWVTTAQASSSSTAASPATPGTTSNVSMVLELVALPAIFLALGLVIYWLVWLYKIHAEMRNYTGGRYPISPGKALGFCFIPFYNLYWVVYAPFKMAQNLESYLGEGTVQPNQVMLFGILSIIPGEVITGLGALFDALAMLRVQRGLNELWDRVRAAGAARADVQIQGAARGGSA